MDLSLSCLVFHVPVALVPLPIPFLFVFPTAQCKLLFQSLLSHFLLFLFLLIFLTFQFLFLCLFPHCLLFQCFLFTFLYCLQPHPSSFTFRTQFLLSDFFLVPSAFPHIPELNNVHNHCQQGHLCVLPLHKSL